MRSFARTLLTLVALVLSALIVSCGAQAPEGIRAEIAKTPPGQATVVFFTDFQCPFCRRTHAALYPVMEERRGRVRLVIRHVPLRRHPDARTAARAAVCVESLGTPDPLAFVHALFAADDLGEKACEALAVQQGVDREQYQKCLLDPATDARIDRDTALFDSLDGDGVPLLYVGRARLDGLQDRRALESAIDAALSSQP